jgi:hypothetical protein
MLITSRPRLLASLLSTLAGAAGAATFVPLESKSTYLLTYNDNPTPPPALAIDLAAYGFHGGDRLLLQVVGDVDNGPGGDTFTFTMGLFSSSSTLLANDQRYRVPGAITSDGPAVVTSPTYFGAKPTDVPQDFGFDKGDGVLVTVPAGAQFLFLAKTDQLYNDNSDPDHDYGVLIGLAPVPEPSTWALWLGGLASVGCVARRRRQFSVA